MREELAQAIKEIYPFSSDEQSEEGQILSEDCNIEPDSKHYWLYAPGEKAFLWDEFYDEGIMGIGWAEIDDLHNYKTKDEIRTKLQEYYNNNNTFHNDTLALWQFAYEMKNGDIVFVKDGLYKIIGYGIIVSDYYYDDERDIFKHIRKVKWIRKGIWEHPGRAAMKTLTDITKYRDYVQKLLVLCKI